MLPLCPKDAVILREGEEGIVVAVHEIGGREVLEVECGPRCVRYVDRADVTPSPTDMLRRLRA